jgi:hypothetical protein
MSTNMNDAPCTRTPIDLSRRWSIGFRRRMGRAARAVLVPVLVLGLAVPLLAQPEGANNKAPGSSAPNRPRGTAPGNQPNQSNAVTRQSQQPPTALPSRFQPPRPAPESFKIEKELISSKAAKEWDRQSSKYRSMLRAGVVTPASQEAVREAARVRVYRMTLKENRNELPKLRAEILRDIRWIPESGGQLRMLLLQELTDRLAELLDGNFYTRFHAVLMLSALDVKDGDRTKQTSAVPFTPAYVPLLKVLEDPNQDEGVKIPAAMGIERILIYANSPSLSREQVRTIANVLSNELQSSNTHFWYQMRLAEALEAGQITSNAGGTPFVVQALAVVVVDKERHPLARAAAAKALGQLPLDATINLSLLANAVGQFTHDMAEEYNSNPSHYYWRDVYRNIYFAYRPTNDSWKRRKLGLMSQAANAANHKKAVEDSYKLALPFVVSILDPQSRPQAFDKNDIDALEKWLSENKPANERVAPELPRLPITKVEAPQAVSAVPGSGF